MFKKIILSVFVVLTVAFASLAKAEAPSESEIPLKLEKTASSQENTSQTGKLFLTLFVLIGMGGASYFLARKYAFSNKINKSNMQIKVLTQHHLGAKKSLAIIRVAGESILIGVTDQNISMIKSLSLIDDEIPAEIPNSFAATMAAGGGEQIVQSKDIADLAFEVEDDFSFAGIKTNVSQKLKSMRNLQ